MSFYKEVKYKIKNGKMTLVSFDTAEPRHVLHASSSKPMRETTSTGPWQPQQQPLTELFGQAKDLYSNYSPQEIQALQAMQAQAQAGTTGLPEAQENLRSTAAGDYLYGGQGFNAALEAAKAKILPDIQSRYARGGQFGSALSRIGEAEAIGNVFASQYGNERNRQMQAAQLIPGLGNAAFGDVQRQMAVAQEPWQRLERYQDIIGKPYGTDTESFKYPSKGSAAGGILGGALAGGQLGQILGGGGKGEVGKAGSKLGGAASGAASGSSFGPWGAAIGGLLGAFG